MRGAASWICLLLGTTLVGCDRYGVNVGAEELCIKDPRLVEAEKRPNSESVSSCATIGENQLLNGSFEAPLLASICEEMFCYVPAAEVPSWTTDSEEQVIEVWGDGFRGVPAPDGSQFAELDARSRDTLSQELELPPGQLMYWSIQHRGRNGIDSMEIRIGSPDAPVIQATLSSPENAWSGEEGLYRVGPEERRTHLALVSRSGVEEGNLVDAVVFAPVQ